MTRLVLFKVQYSRPKQFTDCGEPFEDIEQMNQVLSKSDATLRPSDFGALFGPYSYARSYEEALYFLPLALECIRLRGDDAAELVPGVVRFIVRFASQLEKDRFTNACRISLIRCFVTWTQTFEVFSVTWTSASSSAHRRDAVPFSHAIAELLEAMLSHRLTRPLGELLVQRLGRVPGAMPRSAWFLEYARAVGMGETTPKSRMVRAMVRRKARIRAHASVVRGKATVGSRWEPYLTETLAALGLK